MIHARAGVEKSIRSAVGGRTKEGNDGTDLQDNGKAEGEYKIGCPLF